VTLRLGGVVDGDLTGISACDFPVSSESGSAIGRRWLGTHLLLIAAACPVTGAVRRKHDETEPRFHALGKTLEGRRLHITFTLRAADQLIRAISARDMHRKERVIYEQAT
jgi:hypothetical protein